MGGHFGPGRSRGPPLPGAGEHLPRPSTPRPYQLTASVLASNVGAAVLCLAAEGVGRTFRLFAERPGAHLNRRVSPRADLPSGAAHVIGAVAPQPALIRVDISGPIEQRAGFHDPCGGWSDGNDAIAERLCAAFALGDVLLVVDTPGGVCAGVQQGVAKAQAAKAKYGRKCTAFANEQIGSLGMWWTLAICDELFIPAMGQLGSIGARGGHESIAGQLAKEGREVRYFTWPNEGKIAFAPEFALSEVGAARGNRDVAIAGEAFCAAVVGSPIGLRYGLTREAVIALGADMLTGDAAVAAGLCDGVATEEEVTIYALKQAENVGKDSSAQARAHVENSMKTKAQEDEEARARAGGDDAPPSDPIPEGNEPSTACAGCNAANEPNAKFCDQCGGSMAAKPVAEHDDEAPPSSKPLPAPGAARMTPAASLADVLGLPSGASLPAQKAAAMDLRQVFDHAAKLTGQRGAAAIVGGLTAIATDAAATGRMRAERNTLRGEREAADRLDLCKRLVACGGEQRGRVYLDNVSDAGERTGAPSLAPQFAEMRIATLRGLVEGHEKNAAPRNPFEPDRAKAQEAARNVRPDGLDEKARIEAAMKHPSVIKIASTSPHPIAAIAAQWVKDQDNAAGGVQ